MLIVIKTGGGQDYLSVKVSCGKVKMFFEGCGHTFNWKNFISVIFSTLAFIDVASTELDLIDIRFIFNK